MHSRQPSDPVTGRIPSLDAQAITLGVDRRLASVFRRKGTVQRLSHHQPFSVTGRDAYLLVLNGVVAIATALQDGQDQIVGLIFPGDVLATRLVAPLPRVRAYALGQTELVRMLATDVAADRLSEDNGPIDDVLLTHVEKLWTSAAMQALTIASLPAQQRVVSLIVRLALRLGRFQGNRVTLTLPMSRTDMASYLALNSETLSRTLTRIREAGLVRLSGRREVTIPDWQALCAATPLAATLEVTDRGGRLVSVSQN
jgi:CRP/FNR family transcriptional regulator